MIPSLSTSPPLMSRRRIALAYPVHCLAVFAGGFTRRQACRPGFRGVRSVICAIHGRIRGKILCGPLLAGGVVFGEGVLVVCVPSAIHRCDLAILEDELCP